MLLVSSNYKLLKLQQMKVSVIDSLLIMSVRASSLADQPVCPCVCCHMLFFNCCLIRASDIKVGFLCVGIQLPQVILEYPAASPSSIGLRLLFFRSRGLHRNDRAKYKTPPQQALKSEGVPISEHVHVIAISSLMRGPKQTTPGSTLSYIPHGDDRCSTRCSPSSKARTR